MSDERGLSPWLIAATVLCAVPFFIPYHPPMLDLPQHAAAIMVLNEALAGDAWFIPMFEFEWFRPYWIGYGLIWLLSQVFDLLTATKIVLACAAIATVIGFACLRREVKAPPLLDWYFLALPFGFAYHWGFLNFFVCVPLVPFFLLHYHRFLNGGVSPWAIMAWMVVLFYGHLLMLAFACLAASSMALRGPLSPITWLRRIAPLCLSIPMGIAWMALSIQPRNTENALDWNFGIHRLVVFFPDIFSFDRDLVFVPVAVVLLAIPFLLGYRPRWKLETVAPITFYVLFMVLVPTTVYDNFGTYERFQVFGLMFFALMLGDAAHEETGLFRNAGWLVRAAPGAIGLALLARVAMQSYGFDRESTDFRQVLDRAEPGARAISLVGDRGSLFSPVPVYVHFPLWYQAEKKGIVDFSFAYWPSLTVHYKEAYRPTADVVMAWYPRQFNWERHGGDTYRYFFVRGSNQFVLDVLGQYADRLALVETTGTWHLFERIE